MRLTLIATTLFVTLAFFASPAAHAENVTIPPVETWKEMPVPYPPSGEIAEKFFPKWHKDPRRNNFEGGTNYVRASDGSLTLVMKSWNFWHPEGDTTYRIYDKVRIALLMENGSWVMSDEGEQVRMKWNRLDGCLVSVTVTFTRHANISRTIELR